MRAEAGEGADRRALDTTNESSEGLFNTVERDDSGEPERRRSLIESIRFALWRYNDILFMLRPAREEKHACRVKFLQKVATVYILVVCIDR